MAGSTYLAITAAMRHRAVIEAMPPQLPYAVRYSGLIIAVLAWSTSSWLSVTGPYREATFDLDFLVRLATIATMCAAFSLWGGLWWQRLMGAAMRWAFGRDDRA
jgi:hypothetical protein